MCVLCILQRSAANRGGHDHGSAIAYTLSARADEQDPGTAGKALDPRRDFLQTTKQRKISLKALQYSRAAKANMLEPSSLCFYDILGLDFLCPSRSDPKADVCFLTRSCFSCWRMSKAPCSPGFLGFARIDPWNWGLHVLLAVEIWMWAYLLGVIADLMQII